MAPSNYLVFAGTLYYDLGLAPLGPAATTTGWTFLAAYTGNDPAKAILAAVNLTSPANQIQISVNAAGHAHVVSVKETPSGAEWAGSIVVDDNAWHTIVVQVPGPGAGTLNVFVDHVLDVTAAIGAGVFAAVTPPVGVGSQVGGKLADGTGGGFMGLFAAALFLGIQPIQDVVQDMPFPAETTGARFNRALDMASVPARLRDVAAGTIMCGNDITDESQTKVLSYLQQLELTEQGQCYIASDGTIVFRDRDWRFLHSTSVAVFSDRDPLAYPADLPYATGGVTLNFDRSELYNEIPVTARGGATQMAVDAASTLSYTERTMPGLTDLLMASDADALATAAYILAYTKDPHYRVGDLVVDPVSHDALWPVVLSLDIGDVVTIIKTNLPGGGAPIVLDCRIEGIEHQIDPPVAWKTTYHVSLVV